MIANLFVSVTKQPNDFRPLTGKEPDAVEEFRKAEAAKVLPPPPAGRAKSSGVTQQVPQTRESELPDLHTRPNQAGLPDTLKTGLEAMSGLDLSDIRVHYNSSKPAQLNALAYAQGREIHLGPGQEQHLPHEGWHTVQQMQGRVRPTAQLGGTAINDEPGLESEAERMGQAALRTENQRPPIATPSNQNSASGSPTSPSPVQGKFWIGSTLFESMKEIADDAFAWSIYLRLTSDERDLIREFIGRDNVYDVRTVVGDRLDQVTRLSGHSGERVDGHYHGRAQSREATHLQSRDAEVAILQKAEDWLAARPNLSCYSVAKLYVKISKGPCNSCRSLINEFRQRNQGVRIVIEYTQAAAVTREQVGKDRGQKALSYGYEDALPRSGAASAAASSGFVKVLPETGIAEPSNPKGFKANTLNGIWDQYRSKYAGSRSMTDIDDFISELTWLKREKDEYQENFRRWLIDKAEYEHAITLTASDQAHLSATRAPSRGRDVHAEATLILEL